MRYSTLPAFASDTALPTSSVTVPTRVRHLALRPEDAAELGDDRPHQRGDGDRRVEVRPPLLDPLGEVGGADEVRPGLGGGASGIALGEHGNRDLLAEAVRKRERAAQLLLGVADVDARRMCTSTVSSNLVPAVCLMSDTASAGG